MNAIGNVNVLGFCNKSLSWIAPLLSELNLQGDGVVNVRNGEPQVSKPGQTRLAFLQQHWKHPASGLANSLKELAHFLLLLARSSLAATNFFLQLFHQRLSSHTPHIANGAAFRKQGRSESESAPRWRETKLSAIPAKKSRIGSMALLEKKRDTKSIHMKFNLKRCKVFPESNLSKSLSKCRAGGFSGIASPCPHSTCPSEIALSEVKSSSGWLWRVDCCSGNFTDRVAGYSLSPYAFTASIVFSVSRLLFGNKSYREIRGSERSSTIFLISNDDVSPTARPRGTLTF